MVAKKQGVSFYIGGGVNANLLHDEARQDVHDEASQPGIHGEGLDDGSHEQHGERVLVHQLLHHHRQHLRRVHVLLAEAKVGGWGEERDHGSQTPLLCRTRVHNPPWTRPWITSSLRKLTFDDRLHVALVGVDVVQRDQQVSRRERGHSGASLA